MTWLVVGKINGTYNANSRTEGNRLLTHVHLEQRPTNGNRQVDTTTILRPFFRDHPGEPVPEENSWTLWCKGRLTEADTLTIQLGATPSGLISAHIHHPPTFLRAGCPSCRLTNSIKALKATSAFGLGKTLEFSSTVLPAQSPYHEIGK